MYLGHWWPPLAPILVSCSDSLSPPPGKALFPGRMNNAASMATLPDHTQLTSIYACGSIIKATLLSSLSFLSHHSTLPQRQDRLRTRVSLSTLHQHPSRISPRYSRLDLRDRSPLRAVSTPPLHLNRQHPPELSARQRISSARARRLSFSARMA